MTKVSSSPPRRSRHPFGVFRIFFATSVPRQITVVTCLLLAGLAEGIGLASLLPVLAISAGDAGGDTSAITRLVVDTMTAVGLPLHLGTLLAVVVGGLWLKSGLTLLAMNYVGYTVAEVATGLRLSLIRKLLDVRWGYFARQPVGRFANAISSEAARAADAYLSVATFSTHVIQATIYLFLALLLSWELSLISLLIGAIIVLSLNNLVRASRRAGRQQTKRTQVLVTRLSDTLVGIKPLKAMARHVRLGRLFAADAHDLNEALRRQVFSRQATRHLQEPILAVFLALAFFTATSYLAMPLAQLIVMGYLLVRTVATIGKAQQSYQIATLSESAYWAMQDTIQEAERQKEVFEGTKIPTLQQGCFFEDVSFAYGQKQVLDRVSLAIPAGKVTAITGSSGAGKTTIADLLLGLYRPDEGQIWIDDTSLGEADILAWRGMVGYVPQEVILFHDTIMANVTLGEPEITREDVQAALEAAGAWDFIAALPDGMDSVVGERGTLLSGGQRQRIAVARALVHKPTLLILDEATSALDPETEAAICRNLKALSVQTGLTILAISHQPAWVREADRVYQIHRGRAVEVHDASAKSLAC